MGRRDCTEEHDNILPSGDYRDVTGCAGIRQAAKVRREGYMSANYPRFAFPAALKVGFGCSLMQGSDARQFEVHGTRGHGSGAEGALGTCTVYRR